MARYGNKRTPAPESLDYVGIWLMCPESSCEVQAVDTKGRGVAEPDYYRAPYTIQVLLPPELEREWEATLERQGGGYHWNDQDGDNQHRVSIVRKSKGAQS